MMIVDDKDGLWRPCFAWFPVCVKEGLAWMRVVERRWEEKAHLSVIHPDDRGEWEGAWEYRLPLGRDGGSQ